VLKRLNECFYCLQLIDRHASIDKVKVLGIGYDGQGQDRLRRFMFELGHEFELLTVPLIRSIKVQTLTTHRHGRLDTVKPDTKVLVEEV
jgi:hypothetical protein